jgi:4-amino-4-deoxy-L-arabinose transferase-like glycosyltransferase
MYKVTDAIERHPNRAFAAFLALHTVVWSALPTLFFLNLPLDLIEALTYGREWQLGYDKLPPLPWWMVEVCYRLFGADWSYYLLAQLTVIAAFALVWAMARSLVGAVGAFVAILIIDGLHFFTFTAPKFNHDVIQLPFWALAGFAYWAALRRGRLMCWVLLGLAIGISVWAKYFVMVLVLPLVLFALFDREARRSLAGPGPWISIVIALAVMMPHLVWLVQNDFLPFAYGEARAKPFHGAIDYLYKPPRFLLYQLGFLVPSLLIAAPYLRSDASAHDATVGSADSFDRRIVTLLAFGPALTVVLLSLVTGHDTVSMWGYPLWSFLGLWIVLNARPLGRVTLMRVTFLWGVVSVCFVIAFVYHFAVAPRFFFKEHYVAELFPGDRLGRELSRRYRAMTGKPLSYVIGTMWLGGNVSRYAPERPRVLIDGLLRRSPWIDIGDLRARGAVVVWADGYDPRVLPPMYRGIAGDAEVQEPFTLPFRLGRRRLTLGWAVLRPRPVVAQTPRG